MIQIKPSALLCFSKVAMLLLSPSLSFAQGDVRNGGSPYEESFAGVSSEIRSWIVKGGALSLKFLAPMQSAEYSRKMLTAIDSSKIQFVEESIIVDGVLKVCQNQSRPNEQPVIQCNIDRFKNITPREMFSLVHHEYAGVAGIEVNRNGNSDYSITNQLDRLLELKISYRLKIVPVVPDGFQKFVLKSVKGDFFEGHLNPNDAGQLDKIEKFNRKCTQEESIVRQRLDQHPRAAAGIIVFGETRFESISSSEVVRDRKGEWVGDVTVLRGMKQHCDLYLIAPSNALKIKNSNYREFKNELSIREYLLDRAEEVAYVGATRVGDQIIVLSLSQSDLPQPSPITTTIAPKAALDICEFATNGRVRFRADGSFSSPAGSACDGKFIELGRFQLKFELSPGRNSNYSIAGENIGFGYRPFMGCSLVNVELTLTPAGKIEAIKATGACSKTRLLADGTWQELASKDVTIVVRGQRYVNDYRSE